MELSLIGLQNAGKTSLVNVIAVSKYSYEVFIPLSYMFFSVSFGYYADGSIFCFWFIREDRRI